MNCNYAENVLPLDWLFGTFAADEADAVAGMRRRGLVVQGAVPVREEPANEEGAKGGRACSKSKKK